MNKEQKEILQSQLNNEKQLIEDLKQIFGQAQDDVVNKIIELSKRKDMENLQTIIFQKRYQEVLKTQIDAIIDMLQANEYAKIEEYLTDCYSEGFLGVLYQITKSTSVPMVIPISMNAVAKAIQIDSKLSKTLYKSLDMGELKKTVRMEVSRGILNGSSWLDIGVQIGKSLKGSSFQKPFNNGIRIARTEGHRVQVASTMDAQQEAKDKGADLVKQWDATLDGKTRLHHRELDGKIAEIGEDFVYSGGTVSAPGHFNDPSEDCNCRCALMTRARWGLEGGFTKKDNFTGEFREFNSPKDYEEFKKWYFSKENMDYMNYVEKLEKRHNTKNFKTLLERMDDDEYKHFKKLESASPMWKERERISKSMAYAVDSKTIESRKFVEKFDKMTDDANLRREYISSAKTMLKHRSGQNGEDLYLYNLKSKTWTKSTSGKEPGTPEYTDEIKKAILKAKNGELIAFHNHPASMPPSANDVNAALHNGYLKGYVFCHNGTIYEYKQPKVEVNIQAYNLRVADYQEKGYTEFEAQLKTMEHLSNLYGFEFKEVK